MLINTNHSQPTVKASLSIENVINGRMTRTLELDSNLNPKGSQEAIISPCGANNDKVEVIYYRQLIQNGQFDKDLETIKGMLSKIGLKLNRVSGRTACKVIHLELV